MKHDFARVPDRHGTYSVKYDAAARGKPDGVLPLWLADMDFPSPPCVTDALTERVKHGIFGYSEPDGAYSDALRGWFSHRFDWDVEPDWLVKTPGVVTAVHIAVRALTEPGDGVLIQQPIYYPFASAARLTGRKLFVNQLIYDGSGYRVDFDDFERQIAGGAVKLFILCSPHNPVGRVWTREELTRLGDICLQYGVIVISDEIHQDFVYPGHKQLVFANLKPEYRDITVTCTAPSKTFNLAGLQISNIFIANSGLRERFKMEYARSGLSQSGVMGIIACQAAYEGGGDWLDELLAYLAGNLTYLRTFLAERIPGVKLVEPQGTYLTWLDFGALGLGTKALESLILDKAGVWLSDGPQFGAGGEGFMRMNIACPRQLLREALQRLDKAI